MDPVKDIKILKREYPDAKYYLNFSTPMDLVVATILSAQCRDTIVNATTKSLFARYRTAKDFAKLKDSEVSGITFFMAKAENIRKTAKIIDEKYKGMVPQSLDELTQLPGIGRKTAHAILQNAFGIVDGIVIDTHGIRVSYRLGWTKNKTPEKIETDLMKSVPKQYWKDLPHLVKAHGRAVCMAPVPKCGTCVLQKTCPRQGVVKSS